MAWYTLVPQQRSDVIVDEVAFMGDDDQKRTVSVQTPSELSDSEVDAVRNLGYAVVEAQEPEEEVQPVGSDVAGMSPVVRENPVTDQPAISQQEQENVDQAAAQDRGESAQEYDQSAAQGEQSS